MIARLKALRLLRDCGVVRTRFDHAGLLGLHDEGLADASPVDDDEDALDWRLSLAGKVETRKLEARL